MDSVVIKLNDGVKDYRISITREERSAIEKDPSLLQALWEKVLQQEKELTQKPDKQPPKRRRSRSVGAQPRKRWVSGSPIHDEHSPSKVSSFRKEELQKENDVLSSPLTQPASTFEEHKRLSSYASAEYQISPVTNINQDEHLLKIHASASSASPVSSPPATSNEKAAHRILQENVSENSPPRRSLRQQKRQHTAVPTDAKISTGSLKQHSSKIMSNDQFLALKSSELPKEIHTKILVSSSPKHGAHFAEVMPKAPCETTLQKLSSSESPTKCEVTGGIKLCELSTSQASIYGPKVLSPDPSMVIEEFISHSTSAQDDLIHTCSENTTVAKLGETQGSVSQNTSLCLITPQLISGVSEKQQTSVIKIVSPSTVSTVVPLLTVPQNMVQKTIQSQSPIPSIGSFQILPLQATPASGSSLQTLSLQNTPKISILQDTTQNFAPQHVPEALLNNSQCVQHVQVSSPGGSESDKSMPGTAAPAKHIRNKGIAQQPKILQDESTTLSTENTPQKKGYRSSKYVNKIQGSGKKQTMPDPTDGANREASEIQFCENMLKHELNKQETVLVQGEEKASFKKNVSVVLVPVNIPETSPVCSLQSVTQVDAPQVIVGSVASHISPEKRVLGSPVHVLQIDSEKFMQETTTKGRKKSLPVARKCSTGSKLHKDDKAFTPKAGKGMQSTRQNAATAPCKKEIQPRRILFRKILPRFSPQKTATNHSSQASNYKIIHPLLSPQGTRLRPDHGNVAVNTLCTSRVQNAYGDKSSALSPKKVPETSSSVTKNIEGMLSKRNPTSIEDTGSSCSPPKVMSSNTCKESPVDSVGTACPVKRKRGRPPKARTLRHQITQASVTVPTCKAPSDVSSNVTITDTSTIVSSATESTLQMPSAEISESSSSYVPLSMPTIINDTIPESSGSGTTSFVSETVSHDTPENFPVKMLRSMMESGSSNVDVIPVFMLLKSEIEKNLRFINSALEDEAGVKEWDSNVSFDFLVQCLKQKDVLFSPIIGDINFENIACTMNKIYPKLNTTNSECNEKWWQFVASCELLEREMENLELSECHLSQRSKFRVALTLYQALAVQKISLSHTILQENGNRDDRIGFALQFLSDNLESDGDHTITCAANGSTVSSNVIESFLEFLIWWIVRFRYFKQSVESVCSGFLKRLFKV